MGFEPTTIRLELFCSGPLSYGSKVDAHFGSGKATTLFQRSNSFFWNIVVAWASTFSAFFSRVVCGYHRILRCCAYTWPCAMRRVPGRLRTCAERRLGACLCRLGYGNSADCSPTTVDLRGRINLGIPKEKGKNGMPVMGKNGTVSFGLTNP